MEQIETRNSRAEFLVVYRKTMKRQGEAYMLHWLESKTDFFTAPASCRYHMAYPGGLAAHSVNVWRRLREITIRDMEDQLPQYPVCLPAELEETVALLGLLHDVCKVGVYHQEEGGGYTFRDPLPMGHGEKSLFLITRHMALTEEEALAIRWHMGAYDDAVKGGSRSMTEAMNLTPWVWRLQEADMCATWIDEKGDKPE